MWLISLERLAPRRPKRSKEDLPEQVICSILPNTIGRRKKKIQSWEVSKEMVTRHQTQSKGN